MVYYFFRSFTQEEHSISLCIVKAELQESSAQSPLRFIFLPDTRISVPILVNLPLTAILLSRYICTVDYQRTILHRQG